MSYTGIQPLGFNFSFRGSASTSGGSAATASTAGGGGAVQLNIPTEAGTGSALPPCIPERYVHAAHDACTAQQRVAGLGSLGALPLEYTGAPCRAAVLPVCPAGKEPTLTEPVTPVRRPVVRTIGTRTTTATTPGPAPAWTSKYAPASVRERQAQEREAAAPRAAVPGTPWWVWGLLGGGALLTVALLRKGK